LERGTEGGGEGIGKGDGDKNDQNTLYICMKIA
jgi:hypothetical protein